MTKTSVDLFFEQCCRVKHSKKKKRKRREDTHCRVFTHCIHSPDLESVFCVAFNSCAEVWWSKERQVVLSVYSYLFVCVNLTKVALKGPDRSRLIPPNLLWDILFSFCSHWLITQKWIDWRGMPDQSLCLFSKVCSEHMCVCMCVCGREKTQWKYFLCSIVCVSSGLFPWFTCWDR